MSDVPFSPEELAAGERLAARPWSFLKSVVDLDGLPAADRPEIAFAGRSNVGKSTLINAVAGHRGLARASNTPGRTQQLNFFSPAEARIYVVDMPGYGFAKAPKATVESWTGLIKAYLRGRPTLARVFLLVDARHGVKPVDRTIMTLLGEAAVAYQVVLTKADKVSMRALEEVSAETALALKTLPAAFPLLLATSAETGAGIPELRASVMRLAAEHASAARR